MATYSDPDEFFDKSQIGWGNGGGSESIRDSLKSTNGSVYRTEAIVKTIADQTDAIGEDVFRAITGVLHAPEFAGWQQETRAGAAAVKDLAAKVDALTALVTKLVTPSQ
jgi:uncharacterized protein YukE